MAVIVSSSVLRLVRLPPSQASIAPTRAWAKKPAAMWTDSPSGSVPSGRRSTCCRDEVSKWPASAWWIDASSGSGSA